MPPYASSAPFLVVWLIGLAALGGTRVALHYHRLGLTLSHYDARGHLVVARRILDSITPGWQQIGAVWLPLPHLLNALPVQVDAWYQSGASAVAMSIAAYALTVGAIAWLIVALTASRLAAVAGAAVFALNPNVLYLQSTPMTEPLLLAFTVSGAALLFAWCRTSPPPVATALVGWTLALACLTRYEAWPVTVAALTSACWARWRQGEPFSSAVGQVAAVARVPAGAILAFLVFSRAVVGQWFVSGGFFVPENKALGSPLLASAEVWYGLHLLSGYLIILFAAVGVAALVALGSASKRWAPGLIVVALGATAAVPWVAFMDGHPFRIRYMVPLMALEAIGAGVAAGLVPRLRLALAILLVGAVAYELHPLDLAAPMVVEAQWDRPNVPIRAQVTACLGTHRPGEKIMASMGSLGHYMQETSRAGFALRDFLHEGNGDVWLAAYADGPRPYTEWVLIEEKAEGGDMLAMRAHEQPHFLDGYARVCEGAGLALYKRTDVTGRTAARSGARGAP